MKGRIVFIGFLFLYATTFGQEYLLLGEGRDQEVRLFWTPKKSWPDGLIGFNIKRRASGEWEVLNEEIIKPGTTIEKPLHNLGVSGEGVTRLGEKRQKLLNEGKLKPIETSALIQLLKDENTLKGVSLLLNSDFDIAMIAGFGYRDLQIKEIKGNYEYGLFPVFETGEASEPASVFTWAYGTIPSYKVKMDGEAKPARNKKSVELIFKIDTKSYQQYDNLNGFNVYRKSDNEEFEKLNTSPIWVSLKEEEATLYFKDENVEDSKSYVYAVAPSTIFNTAGNRTELEVKFEDGDEEVAPPKLNSPSLDGGALRLDWEFDRNHEKSIKGFYVQRKEENSNQFKIISELLSGEIRSFNYNLPDPDNQYYHVRVIAIRNDGLEIWSNRKIYFHEKNTKPNKPDGLQGSLDDRTIKLQWNLPETQDIKGYYLYTSAPNEDRLVKEGSVIITGTSHDYKIFKDTSARYRFAVSAYNTQYEEGDLSDPIDIIVPSKVLPFVIIWPAVLEEDVVTLNWEYPDDISDLAGFRLYQNNELIADQQALSKNTRSWTSTALEQGRYSYQVVAVSETEVESKRSNPRIFEVK